MTPAMLAAAADGDWAVAEHVPNTGAHDGSAVGVAPGRADRATAVPSSWDSPCSCPEACLRDHQLD